MLRWVVHEKTGPDYFSLYYYIYMRTFNFTYLTYLYFVLFLYIKMLVHKAPSVSDNELTLIYTVYTDTINEFVCGDVTRFI